MARRSLGHLSKRSRLLRKRTRARTGISRTIREFSPGDKVSIDPKQPHSGMPHPRYRGRTGVVVSRQGKSYRVKLKIGRTEKVLIVPSVHLR